MSSRIKQMVTEMRQAREKDALEDPKRVKLRPDVPVIRQDRKPTLPETPVAVAPSSSAERMNALNAAFSKRTAVIDEYQRVMKMVRSKLKGSYDQLITIQQEVGRLQGEANKDSNRGDASIIAELAAAKEEQSTYETQVAGHKKEIEDADVERLDALAKIDAEIESLGGRLTLAPKATK